MFNTVKYSDVSLFFRFINSLLFVSIRVNFTKYLFFIVDWALFNCWGRFPGWFPRHEGGGGLANEIPAPQGKSFIIDVFPTVLRFSIWTFAIYYMFCRSVGGLFVPFNIYRKAS